ncbi:MAG: SDR family oxidoreductase [Acetobacteraceae bacterium]|nr:SDR family oxidoreductase [Acetobacteraceae bacterium]
MNKTAVVTGAASGIGAHTARRLCADGWHVFGLDLPSATLQAAENFTPLPCDVRDPAQVESAFNGVGGKLNALIACAGILRTGPIADQTVEDFDLVFNVNVRGLWLCAKYALPALKQAAADGETARIVLLSSIASIRPKVNGGVYAASKAAVSQLTKVLAVENASYGVLINAVAPATVDTPMVRPALASNAGNYKPSGKSPLGRIAEPEDVVRLIRFLLSDDSAYMTGTIIPVDGGTAAAFVPA